MLEPVPYRCYKRVVRKLHTYNLKQKKDKEVKISLYHAP